MKSHASLPLSSFVYDCGRISFIGVLLASSSLWGQAGQAARPTSNTPAAASSEPSNETKPNEADDSITLTPFDVVTTSDKSYGALNSNSITRFNTELAKLPVSADIFTSAFIKDTGVNSVESMIQLYSPGAGFSTSDPGSAGATMQSGDRNGNAYIQLRGLNTPTSQRNGFMAIGAYGNPGSTGVGTTSLFDIDRVEVIKGPQALLYGGGGAGGVVNVVSKMATFGRTSGNASYAIDQYGSKDAEVDFNFGTDRFAVRVAAIQQTQLGRRINIGGDISGEYVQFAVRPFRNTTVRLELEQTKFFRIVNGNNTVILPTSDPRNNYNLHYLLATNQAGATNPVTGAAYPAGAIDNGQLNWSNVDSYQGWMASELVVNDYITLTADTKWNEWLSTQLAVGYNTYMGDRASATFNLLGPGASGNTLPGWSGTLTPADSYQPSRAKAIRFSTVVTKDLFNGRAKTQTILGGDFIRTDLAQIAYAWFQADGNFNAIVGSNPNTTNNGRTIIPKLVWSVDNGPLLYPYFYPLSNKVTINGTNYVRQLQNPSLAANVTPGNPLGVILGGSNYIQTKVFSKGIFGVTSIEWFDGKLTTLGGFRLSSSDEDRLEQGNAPPAVPGTRKQALSDDASFNLGVNYALNSWLRPYIGVSDSYNPPYVQQVDPAGNVAKTGHGLGGEAGLKFSTHNDVLSGSLAFYKTKSKNEEILISSTILNDINPQGLNGRFGSANQWINVDRKTQGAEFLITANPTPNWRLRLSTAYTDGTVGNTVTYKQYYNDQFYANNTGQVTYQDGSVVYVSDATGKISTAATAGAVPLTLQKMNSATDPFYANPAPVSGAIASNSAVATVLKTTDSTHGAILTGVAGLPISALQVAPLASFPPPGVVPATIAGEKTVGYPQYSASFTNRYFFSRGWMKGLSIGETARVGWKYRSFYYWPNGILPGTSRALYSLPTQTYFDLILGYEYRFRHVTFSTQLNVNNIFNHYHLLIIPNGNTGFVGSGVNASFDQMPRAWRWANTISF